MGIDMLDSSNGFGIVGKMAEWAAFGMYILMDIGMNIHTLGHKDAQ